MLPPPLSSMSTFAPRSLPRLYASASRAPRIMSCATLSFFMMHSWLVSSRSVLQVQSNARHLSAATSSAITFVPAPTGVGRGQRSNMRQRVDSKTQSTLRTRGLQRR
jgi:hypothetical protein